MDGYYAFGLCICYGWYGFPYAYGYFWTNVLVLRLWWLIGGAFILFDDEGGEWFNKCYENMHISRGSMYAGGVFVK